MIDFINYYYDLYPSSINNIDDKYMFCVDIDKYYFGIEEQSSTGYIPLSNVTINGIEYFESSEPTYTCTGLKSNTDYKVYAFAEDKEGFRSDIYNTTITTNNYVLPEVTNVTTEVLDLHIIKITAVTTYKNIFSTLFSKSVKT